jgi:peptidoglycan/xylan/chitin deacetylase (PgdA/CDA1 family)
MKRLLLALCVAGCVGTGTSAFAADCNGKSDALGVSRVIAVDPKEHTRVGTMQYPETLPLADHEVVLSFDDGPSPRYTDRILDTLSGECVKAVFFMVGMMTKNFPDVAKRVAAAGHTIGTHSFHHPFTFQKMTEDEAGAEIDQGVDAVVAALGGADKVAPFFRVPGFLTSASTEAAIASRGLMTWSADFPADDWKGISSAEIVKRAMSRIEAKGRGILLLHDIHRQTMDALPVLLAQLKQNGFKIVQVVPASDTVPKTETTPEQWTIPHQEHPTEQAGAKKDSASPAIAEVAKGDAKSNARRLRKFKRVAAHHRRGGAKPSAIGSHKQRAARHPRLRAHSVPAPHPNG